MPCAIAPSCCTSAAISRKPRGLIVRYSTAVDLLRPVALAIKAGPVHADLGNAYTGLSRFEDAVRHYDQAIELEPGAAAALYNRGNALRALGRRTEALASHHR